MRQDGVGFFVLGRGRMGLDLFNNGWDGFDEMGIEWAGCSSVLGHGRMGLDLDLVLGRGRMGLDLFNDGWDGIGDSYSWITNIQWLLLMFRVVSMVKKY